MDTILVSHAAFAYMAKRYDLNKCLWQESVRAEPSPKTIADIIDVAIMILNIFFRDFS